MGFILAVVALCIGIGVLFGPLAVAAFLLMVGGFLMWAASA